MYHKMIEQLPDHEYSIEQIKAENEKLKDELNTAEKAFYEKREADAYRAGYEDGKRDAMKWISVKERLPEMGQTVVCAVYGTDMIVQEDGETFVDALRRNRKHAHIELGYLAEDGWNGWEGYPMMVSPSYWMPFPDIPMPEVEEEK